LAKTTRTASVRLETTKTFPPSAQCTAHNRPVRFCAARRFSSVRQ
jgi:hypothetical protein